MLNMLENNSMLLKWYLEQMKFKLKPVTLNKMHQQKRTSWWENKYETNKKTTLIRYISSHNGKLDKTTILSPANREMSLRCY